MEFSDTDDVMREDITPEQRNTVSLIGKVVKKYLNTAKDLLDGKYAHIQDYAPEYLRNPGNVLIACGPEGVVIRYEKKVDTFKTYSAWLPMNLTEAASTISQNLIHCHSSRNYTPADTDRGIDIKLTVRNPQTNKNKDVLSTRIIFNAILEKPCSFPTPPQKPFCLLSVHSTMTLGIEFDLVDDGAREDSGQRMLSLTQLPLPVGWDCIEVYPYLNLDHWKAEYAPIWAENDILAAVATKQHRELHLRSLDPNAESRKEFAKLLSEFKDLLDSEPDREEVLQTFLKNHPELLCPVHDKMWPKLKLGDRITDFVFRDATSNYLLVELEPSTFRLFRKDGQPTQKLNHAKDQITDWKRYIEDNLTALQREQRLTGLSSNPRSLVVIGRSRDLTTDNRRKLTAMENEHPKLQIMTYDDIYDNFRNVITNLLGPLIDAGSTTEIFHLK